MTAFQIIGIVVVALIGLGIFYAIYRIERHDYPDGKIEKDKPRHRKVFQRRLFVLSRFVSTPSRRDDTIVTAGPDPWQHPSRPAP